MEKGQQWHLASCLPYNLRAALSWSVEQAKDAGNERDEEAGLRKETALRLAAALVHFSVVHWYISEGYAWLDRALANSEGVPPQVRIKALSGAGWLAFHQSDIERADVNSAILLTHF